MNNKENSINCVIRGANNLPLQFHLGYTTDQIPNLVICFVLYHKINIEFFICVLNVNKFNMQQLSRVNNYDL